MADFEGIIKSEAERQRDLEQVSTFEEKRAAAKAAYETADEGVAAVETLQPAVVVGERTETPDYISEYRESVKKAGEGYGQAKQDYLGYFSGLVDDLQGRYDKATKETDEAKKAHAKSQRINALGEGLSAIANLWTTVKGATPMRLPSPTQQAQRRFDYDQAKRDREREKYERLVRAAEEGRAGTLFGLAGQDYKNALENAGNILGANQERERLARQAALDEEKLKMDKAVADSVIKKNNAAAKKSEADANAKASGENGKSEYTTSYYIPSTGEVLPITDESMKRIMDSLGQKLYDQELDRIDEEIQELGGVKRRNPEMGRIRANRDEVSELLERKKALENILLAGFEGGEERLEALRAWLAQNIEKYPELLNAMRRVSKYDSRNRGVDPSTYYIMDSATPARERTGTGQGGEDDEFPDMKVNRYSNQFINY